MTKELTKAQSKARWKSINKITRHGAYAYIPGTGPARRTCGSCQWCENAAATTYCCRKWRHLMMPNDPDGSFGRGEDDNHQPRILRSTAACKYYEMNEFTKAQEDRD